MQEKYKNVSTVEFLRSFGRKILCGESMPVQDDQTDQRAPVNDPEALYEQFVVPSDMMEELENETLEDFDLDVTDYDDRTDFGVDIAASADLVRESNKMKKQKKPAENKDKVIPAKEEPSEAE